LGVKELTMTVQVINPSRFYFEVKSAASKVITRPASLAEIIFLGITLATLQILDGLLTGIGVSQLGVGMEANSFIRSLMVSWGYVTALTVIKGCALIIIAVLCRLALTVPWVTTAFKGIIILYLTLAIVPWTVILVNRVW
jgi:Domain of unknown function (DUF5658)